MTSEKINEQVLSDLKSYLESEEIKPYFSQFYTDDLKSNRVKSPPNRFLINLYETQRFKKKNLIQKSKLNLACNNRDNFICKNNDLVMRRATMQQFITLRNKRDVECLKLKEASKLLKYLNKHSINNNWNERLLAEKVLLESGVAADILKNKICNEYSCMKLKEIQIGTLSLLDFKFRLNKPAINGNKTDFYVLLLMNEDEVTTSKIQRASNGEIEFNENFTFPINRNLQIKIQLHTIVMKEVSKIANCLPGARMHKRQCLKMQYKNLNTCDYEETKVLKTSFQLAAETEIVLANLHNKAWELKLSATSPLNEFLTVTTKVEQFKIELQRDGFLTFGTPFCDRIVWNRRWCILNGQSLEIYSSPTDENFSKPQLILDLLDCPSPKIEEAPKSICNRRRTLMIPIKNNDVVKNYFLMADDFRDLKRWLDDFNKILDLLNVKRNYKL